MRIYSHLKSVVGKFVNLILRHKIIAREYAQKLDVELQVVETPKFKILVDENMALYSPEFIPGNIANLNIWDAFLLTPQFLNNPKNLNKVLILGLGAGYVSNGLFEYYKNISIHGVEFEPAIIKLGRQHFNFENPGLKVFVQDARAYINQTDSKYDLIIVDLYLGKKVVPFVIQEDFVKALWRHLNLPGVIAINLAKLPSQIVNSFLCQTAASAFNLPLKPINNLFIATNSAQPQSRLKERFLLMSESCLKKLSDYFALKLQQLK